MSNLLAYGHTVYRLLNSSLHPSLIAIFPLQRLSFSYQQCNKWFPIALSPYSLTFIKLFLSKATKMIYLYLSTNMTVPVSSTTKSRSPIVYNLKHLLLHHQEGLLASPAALLITTSFYYTYHAKFCFHTPLSSMPG